MLMPCFQLLRIGLSTGDSARDLFTFRPALSRSVFRLGRAAELCDVTLESTAVSRIHAELHAEKEGWRVHVKDRSSHGTWVNDVRLQPGALWELSDGDTLTFGGHSTPGNPEFYFLFQKVKVRPLDFDAITIPKAEALQVRVRRLRLPSASPAAAQAPQRRPASAGGQALPGGHPDHRQLPRRHDEQPAEPAAAAGFLRRRGSAPAGGGDGQPGQNRQREHRRFPPTESCPRLADGAERQEAGQQLAGVLPPGGGRGELQPGVAHREDPHRRQRRRPVQPIPPSNSVRNEVCPAAGGRGKNGRMWLFLVNKFIS
uniref:Transcription factor 19 (SC1), like n=1 Tax=Fundulus heteroclitus TaxID=8078 RepID=A0A3Q2PBI0_FUNHE